MRVLMGPAQEMEEPEAEALYGFKAWLPFQQILFLQWQAEIRGESELHIVRWDPPQVLLV